MERVVVAGRYRLERPLGAGGMARVVEASDLRLGRKVAVKLLSAGSSDDPARARFLREARTAAGFSHPHAVAVYDAGEDDGELYIVMELIDGHNLAQVLAQRGPLEPDEAIAITDQLLAALGAAHQEGIVHRDVKPGNVLLSGSVVKLADFGIATVAGDIAATLTATGQVIGTAIYLSPERAAGLPATASSDIYAVGVLLYEMLAGAPPFSGDTPFATALAHQQAPVPDLTHDRPTIDPAVASVVQRALAKQPEDRYPSAAAMRAALTSPGAETKESPTPTLTPTKTMATRLAPATMSRTETATTQLAPSSISTPRRRPALLAAALLGAVAVAGLIGALILDDGGPTPRALLEVESTTQPGAVATTTTIATTTSSVPSASATGIASLTEALVRRPGAYGEKQPDLLDKLQYVEQQTGAKRVEEADKLIDELSKWTQEGELDFQIATEAIQVLEASRGG